METALPYLAAKITSNIGFGVALISQLRIASILGVHSMVEDLLHAILDLLMYTQGKTFISAFVLAIMYLQGTSTRKPAKDRRSCLKNNANSMHALFRIFILSWKCSPIDLRQFNAM